jgi:hypothetical protein
MPPKATPAKAAPAKVSPAKAVPAKTPGKAVTKATPQASAVGMPAEMSDLFLQHAGAGLEKATAADFALPFIYLLQKMSPQVDPDSEKFIDGAKVGMFLNTVTGQLYESLTVVPVDFEKVYIEWVPRDAGGGFVAQYRSKNEAEMNKREDTQIVDTANHYVLVQEEDGSWTPAILSMTSTKLKASRKWLSVISMVTINTAQGKRVAPSFSRMYEVVKEGPITNDKGTFYTVKVNSIEGEDGWVHDQELFDQALSFRAQLQAGAVGADYNKAGDTIVDGEVTDDGAEM